MANKALATRQRMQFRVEPAQMPAHLKNQRRPAMAPGFPAKHPTKLASAAKHATAVASAVKTTVTSALPSTAIATPTPTLTPPSLCGLTSDAAQNDSHHNGNDNV